VLEVTQVRTGSSAAHHAVAWPAAGTASTSRAATPGGFPGGRDVCRTERSRFGTQRQPAQHSPLPGARQRPSRSPMTRTVKRTSMHSSQFHWPAGVTDAGEPSGHSHSESVMETATRPLASWRSANSFSCLPTRERVCRAFAQRLGLVSQPTRDRRVIGHTGVWQKSLRQQRGSCGDPTTDRPTGLRMRVEPPVCPFREWFGESTVRFQNSWKEPLTQTL
jgi:hypothetical protein